VCIGTVESGFMNRDLAVLISPDQMWMNGPVGATARLSLLTGGG
jgi:hypothetical protein